MQFDDDEYCAGALSLDFVNTLGGDRAGATNEKLGQYGDLLDWLAHAGALPRTRIARLEALAKAGPDAADRLMRRARAFREALFAVFDAVRRHKAPAPAALEIVNGEIARANSHARLVRGGHHLRWDWDDENALDTPLWPIAREAGELLTSDKLGRLAECSGDTCGWLFLDLTKNHSRRWCDMKGCGNRAKVRRYRGKV
ncbi:MAG TPA: ABATE domain-containing protein [Rhizomicrobium sp.]|nr:ABATE domain-containing protein [Rhizomicrobium sp.]